MENCDVEKNRDDYQLYIEEVKNFDKKIRDIRLSLESFMGKKEMDDYFNDRTVGKYNRVAERLF